MSLRRGELAVASPPLLRGLTLLLLACIAAGICGRPACAAPKFPPLSGRVVDEAGLLSADDRRSIEQQLLSLERTSSDQLVVFIARSLQGYPIEDYGYQLGRAWQIGQKGKDNGVILIIAPSERKVRIEVGRGLEPQLTDLMSKLIVENAILPAFRRNDFAGGIKAGVRDIRDVLLGDAAAVAERAKTRPAVQGGGNTALLLLLIFIALGFTLVYWQARQTAYRPGVGAARRRGGGDVIFPVPYGGSYGGWRSGAGDGSPGGDFGGGGGDFGGGGASGSW